MATLKQEKAVNLLLENVRNSQPLSKGQILQKAGYKEISKQPNRILNSKGVQDLLKKHNIDKDSRLKILGEIMNDRDNNKRLRDKRAVISANKEISQMLGEYASTKIDLNRTNEMLGCIADD